MGFEGAPKPNRKEQPNDPVAETAAVFEQLKAKNSKNEEERLPGQLSLTEEEELKRILQTIKEGE